MKRPPPRTAVEEQSPPRPWAVCLGRADAAAVGRVRLFPGIEVCEHPEAVWLRGPSQDEALARRLRALPGAQRFYVLPDGQLQPVASRLPRGRLPEGPWKPLRQWLTLTLPPPGLAGRCDRKAPLALAPSTRVSKSVCHCLPQAVPESTSTAALLAASSGTRSHGETDLPTPNLLLTTLDAWAAYAVAAPQVRLDRWQFAVCDDGRVAVRGVPLPPLPGTRWIEREGVAVPAGYEWSPPVEAKVVRAAFGLSPGETALWHANGAWQRIGGDDFVRASRAAVRASLEGRGHAEAR